MDKRKIISIAGLLAAALGVLFLVGFLSQPREIEEPGTIEEVAEENMRTYTSADAGVLFEYSEDYRLEERSETFEGAPMNIAVLMDTDAVIPEMSEGPPSISLIVAENPENLSLEEWVRTKNISNFAISTDGQLSQTTIGGEPALYYRHSGLYENDAVAIARGGKIYLFAASWMSEDDLIRDDFDTLLGSVEFI